jgi:hypothetical protein
VRAFTFWDRALNPVRSYRSIGVRPPLSRCLLRSTLAGAYTDSTHQGPRVRYAHTYSCLNVSTNTGTSRSSCSPGAQLRCNSTTDRRTVRKMHQLEFGEPHRNEPASKKGAGTNTPANSRTTRNQGRGKPRPGELACGRGGGVLPDKHVLVGPSPTAQAFAKPRSNRSRSIIIAAPVPPRASSAVYAAAKTVLGRVRSSSQSSERRPRTNHSRRSVLDHMARGRDPRRRRRERRDGWWV